MSCCGKAKNIVAGYTNLAVEKVTHTPVIGTELLQTRSQQCHKPPNGCEKLTWYKMRDAIPYIRQQRMAILTHFDKLEELPELEKKEKQPGTMPLCMVCKCFLPAKIRVENEKCPLGKW